MAVSSSPSAPVSASTATWTGRWWCRPSATTPSSPSSRSSHEGADPDHCPRPEGFARPGEDESHCSTLTPTGLQSLNLGHLAGRLGSLDGLDRVGVLAAISVTLAERERDDSTKVELVWTGPEAATSTSRDTAVVVHQLFVSAQRSVLIAGYAFDHGKDILRPLHEAMKDRGVTVEIFMDLRERAPVGEDIEAFAADRIDRFIQDNWPFGEPWPTLYYAPATISPSSMASVHAKCVVVDGATTLITSANFTDRGQTRNIEAGVLLSDKQLSVQLIAQWKGVVAGGGFTEHKIRRE